MLIDAGRAAAEAALAAFAEQAEGAEIALFFFAGHGVQIEGDNHLLDSRVLDPEPRRRLPARRSAWMRSAPRWPRRSRELGLIVLDACRNNPLAEGGLAPAAWRAPRAARGC